MKKLATLRFHFLSLILTTVIFITNANANNISVSNISITGQNTTAGTNNPANYSMVKFNIAWENSWRSAALNWDAAWVFVKYRVNGGDWQHCNLNNIGHTAPAGSTIDVGLVTPSSAFNATSNPAVGVFIYKNADGTGNVNYQNVQLRWNYGSQGVADNAVLDVQVFAIEMVYVPTGTFAVGDGVNGYTLTTINTGNATTVPSGTGSLGGQAGGYPTGTTAPASPNCPNGYNAFYCMKYEITQGLYRDFLNTLSYNQQLGVTVVGGFQPINIVGNYALVGINGVVNGYSGGNKIRVKFAANETNLTPAVFETINDNFACNFLDGNFIGSVLDWCGLRPMTDLEYEKSCRGPVAPLPNDYAWGSSILATNNNFVWKTGQVSRVGSFATNNSSRTDAGATFYGIMDMTGNVTEITNTIGLTSHGDGNISNNGSYTNSDWTLSQTKGGRTFDLASSNDVPSFVSTISNEGYSNATGGRGVRSAQ